jgi:hypothetical protein
MRLDDGNKVAVALDLLLQPRFQNILLRLTGHTDSQD